MNYGMIAHGYDKDRNMINHGVIAHLCYCNRAELSMQMMEGLDGWRLMEHVSAKDAVLTLAGASPGSGVLYEQV